MKTITLEDGQTGELVRLLSLVGKDVAGQIADIRSRKASGALEYAELEDQKRPIYVTLKRVEVISRKHPETTKSTEGDWLYWRYDGHGCGYSGRWNIRATETKSVSIVLVERKAKR